MIERPSKQSTGSRETGAFSGFTRRDWLAVGLILMGYVAACILMLPVRDFGLLDDWVYAQSAEKLAGGQGFAPAQYAQATLAAHAFWGATFIAVLGNTFSAVTVATMAASLVCALTFYAILRLLGFSVGKSGLGVAIITLNPFYLYLSYTFMTEITFTALMLLACLCYLLGAKREQEGGSQRGAGSPASSRNYVYAAYFAGGLFGALAFLTRQFGVALPLAALLWLLLARRWTWGKALAITALPLAATVGYYIWSAGFGTTFSGSIGREEMLELLRPAEWAQRASRFVYFALFLPGLTIPLWSRPRRWPLALGLSVLVAGAAFVLWRAKLNLVEQGQSSLDELSFVWLSPIFGERLLITLVYSLGAGLAVWLMFGMLERGLPVAVASVRGRQSAPAAMLFFLVGAILFAGTYGVSAGFLDRYWVPLLPFLIAGALYGTGRWNVRSQVLAIAVVAVMGTYGAVIHLDDYAETGARWKAGRALTAEGVPLLKIENGYGWDGYFLYDQLIAQYPDKDVNTIGRAFLPYQAIDPQYLIDTALRPGYRQISSIPYFSIMDGFREREMLVMEREE